jgi:hypothetical protein
MAALLKLKGEPINATGTFLNLMRPVRPEHRNNSLASFLPVRFLSHAEKTIGQLKQVKHSAYKNHLRSIKIDEHGYMSMTDDDIISLAKVKADRYAFQLTDESINDWFYAYQQITDDLSAIGLTAKSVPVRNPKDSDYRAACLRLTNPLWWRRQFRRAASRSIENHHVMAGHVGRPLNQLYISDELLSRRQYQRRRNARLLESLVAINDQGYENDLLSLQMVSTSNPEIRRNELMARLHGLESYAKSHKLAADFYTLTAPSCMHRYTSVKQKNDSYSSFLNQNFDGSTPKQTQAYLNKQWSKIRAELDRRKISLLGVRVAEPHHDGTPHWHMLFFFHKSQRSEIRQVIRHYALEHSPNEKGAQKHRFTAKKIKWKSKDGKPQSAVGYVAKYISKNLSVTETTATLNNDGKPVHTTVDRVEAWASTWGIRQFQQIGGERITIWRELRRIRKTDAEFESMPSDFKETYHAADSGDYHQFIEASRDRSKIEMLRNFVRLSNNKTVERINLDTGEISTFQDHELFNHYGEPKVSNVIGLICGNSVLITRNTTWRLKPRREKPAVRAAARTDGLLPSLDLCQ